MLWSGYAWWNVINWRGADKREKKTGASSSIKIVQSIQEILWKVQENPKSEDVAPSKWTFYLRRCLQKSFCLMKTNNHLRWIWASLFECNKKKSFYDLVRKIISHNVLIFLADISLRLYEQFVSKMIVSHKTMKMQ